MSDDRDYVKEQRLKSLTDLSVVSEAELHACSDSIKNSWTDIQELKRKIALEKQEAIKQIDQKYASELSALESDYALMMTLSR